MTAPANQDVRGTAMTGWGNVVYHISSSSSDGQMRYKDHTRRTGYRHQQATCGTEDSEPRRKASIHVDTGHWQRSPRHREPVPLVLKVEITGSDDTGNLRIMMTNRKPVKENGGHIGDGLERYGRRRTHRREKNTSESKARAETSQPSILCKALGKRV